MHGEKETTHYKLFLIKSRMLMTFWHILGKWKIVNKARIKWMCKMSHWMLGIHYIVQPMMKCIVLDRERVRLVKCIQMCCWLGTATGHTQSHNDTLTSAGWTLGHWHSQTLGRCSGWGPEPEIVWADFNSSIELYNWSRSIQHSFYLQSKVKVTW